MSCGGCWGRGCHRPPIITLFFIQAPNQQNACFCLLSPFPHQPCTHRKAISRPRTPLGNRSPISLETVNLKGEGGIRVEGKNQQPGLQAPGEVQTWPKNCHRPEQKRNLWQGLSLCTGSVTPVLSKWQRHCVGIKVWVLELAVWVQTLALPFISCVTWDRLTSLGLSFLSYKIRLITASTS